MLRASTLAMIVGLSVFTAATATAGVVQINPSKDNTLYEMPDGSLDDNSNGEGIHCFSGHTGFDLTRRAVMAFDIASYVPAGAYISGATLTLYMSQTNAFAPAATVSMQRLTADWGEGASNAPLEEGQGEPAAPGDATWKHTFYPGSLWSSEGGDFSATASASTLVDQVGTYSWSSAQLAADVQDMLDNPGGNYGWILVGDESQPMTSKRFDTREVTVPEQRPVLEIQYVFPIPAASTVGLAIMVALLLVAGGGVILQRARGSQV